MKICLVTTFPPSRGGLSEYGFHLAFELQRNPLLSVTILADELPSAQPEMESFSVLRCWSADDSSSPLRLLSVLRKLDPDVVWFNLVFSTFGRNPLAAFSGLASPLLTRLSGYYTHVTLHHLMDTVDMKDAGVRFGHVYRVAGNLATRMLLRSNSVSVTLPAYRRILLEKYRGQNVHLRAHGIFSGRPEYPDFSRRGYPEHRILAFGKWGTYKRLELLIESFQLVCDRVPHAKLVIAGGDHPKARGYLQSCADAPVYLHDDFYFFVAGKFGIEIRPSNSPEAFLVAEHFPEFFREMRSHGREHQHERFENVLGNFGPNTVFERRMNFVVEIHN